MAPFTLPFCKRLHEILGDFETDRIWYKVDINAWEEGDWSDAMNNGKDFSNSTAIGYGIVSIPSPSFQELLRLMPKIGERMKWEIWINRSEEGGNGIWDTIEAMTDYYIESPS